MNKDVTMGMDVGAGHARDSESAGKNHKASRPDSIGNKPLPSGKSGTSSRLDSNRGHGPLPQGFRTAILGFGNRLWGDDGAGSVLAERLKAANPDAAVFDGGMVPENYLEKVVAADPDTILLIDACDFGGKLGEWRIFSGEELAFTGISTHAGSPRMLAAYLDERTEAEVKLLAIQPEEMGEGDILSPGVATTITDLVSRILF